MSPLETVSTGADVATPSDAATDAQQKRQQSSLPYEERSRLPKECVAYDEASTVTNKLGENTDEEKSAAEAAAAAAAAAASPSNDTKTLNVESVAAPRDDADTTAEGTCKTSSNSRTSVTSVASVDGGPSSASGETVIHHQAPPPIGLQGSGAYHFGRGLSSSYGPPPPHEYGGRSNYPPPSYSDNGLGHYPPHVRGGYASSSYPHPIHNANHHYPPTGNHHYHHHQQRYGGHAPPPNSSSYGVPPQGLQPSLSKHAPRNQHVGEEYARRHSPAARYHQQTSQSQEEKKTDEDEHHGDTRSSTSSKGATAGLSEEKAKGETENSGVADVVPPNATTGILRTTRGSIVADLAVDDSHPDADDVEPLPPKTLFHSSAEGSENKPERSPSGIMKDSSSVVSGSTNPTKKERHVGFEADSKLPATSGASSHPPHLHSYYEHGNYHGHGKANYSLSHPLPSYPPGPYHHHHHHQPPHSYGGYPAGIGGHGMVVDPHHPSPPPPVHSPYYAEYRPRSTGEYRPAASLRRADDEKPMVNGQKREQEDPVAADSVAVANKDEKNLEETSPTSSVTESTKGDEDRKEKSGDANETPMQHHQQAQANPNNHDASVSPYAPYDAYAPFGRYQPPPSGMRIGGGPGNRHYDHSPMDANPDRQKPRAESYEIDPRDPRAVAGFQAPNNSAVELGHGHGHGHYAHNPPVTPHGYFSHHHEGPFDVRCGMDRLVATPASGGFVSSVRGRPYDSFEQAGEDPYRHHLGRFTTPSGHAGFNDYPPLSEIKPDGPHPSPMALDKDTFFRASPQQPGRPSASPISRTDFSGRLSYPPTTPHFDARYQEENYTPLRYDRAHPLPSASKGTESLFPSPTQRSTFSGGITYATPLVRRKGGEEGDKESNSLDSPSRVAADAAAAAAAHQHFYHQYDGPPSPAAKFPPPHPVHGYTPNFGPLPTNNSSGHSMQLPAVGAPAVAKSTTAKKRKKAADGTKKASKSNKDDRRQKMYSNYTGVTYNKTHAKYQACITHYRKQHYLGRYKLAVDAARAYDESAKLLKGSGWKINFGTIDDYEMAKKEELEHLMEKERAEEEAAAAEGNGSRKKKKKVTARDLAHIAVKIQVPSSVFKVVSEANGQAAARQAQKIIAEVNQATIERVKLQKENSESPTTSLPSRRNELPSKTPSNTAGRASMEVTPSPFAFGANGQAASSIAVAFTPSNNKTGKDQGGADIAATGNDYTPNSELRPKKIVKEAAAMPTATHGPKAGGRIITPQQKPGEDEAEVALTLSAMKR